MSLRIADRKKVILINNSIKYGLKPFSEQVYLSFCDTFLWRRHLIYCAKKDDVLKKEIGKIDGLDFREVKGWSDFSKNTQLYLLKNRELLQWGDPSWFDRGWRLWAGEFGGDLATLCWWRSPENSRDFFIDIPDDSELMWQSTTIPKFRSSGLFTYQRLNLLRMRIKEGVNRFFVCCEAFNTTGKKNLPKQGFKYIGRHTRSKITGRKKLELLIE